MWISYFAKRWFLLLMASAIGASLLTPQWMAWLLRPMETRPIMLMLLFLMSVSLESRRLLEIIRRPWPALLAVFICYGLAPPLSYVFGSAFLSQDYRIGLIVVGSLPCTMASATIWTRLAGGNEAVSLMVTMITNSLVFLFTAGWLSLLTGQAVSFDSTAMILDLLKVVVAPILVGQILRRIGDVGTTVANYKRSISIACRLLILIVIAKSAAGAELDLAEQGRSLLTDVQLLVVLVVCIAVHLLLLASGYWMGKKMFSAADAVAVAFAGSQKTLPVGVFLIADYYQSTPLAIVPMLFFHVGQLVVDTYIAERLFYEHSHPHLVADETAPESELHAQDASG